MRVWWRRGEAGSACVGTGEEVWWLAGRGSVWRYGRAGVVGRAVGRASVGRRHTPSPASLAGTARLLGLHLLHHRPPLPPARPAERESELRDNEWEWVRGRVETLSVAPAGRVSLL